MNRIVLIGNGFDLAHNLPTRYEDFIDDYWSGFIKSCLSQDMWNRAALYKYDCISLIFPHDHSLVLSDLFNEEKRKMVFNPLYEPKIAYKELKLKIEEYNKEYLSLTTHIKLNIENQFLKHLFETISLDNKKNWVDIENEYYKFLSYQFDRHKLNGYNYSSIEQLNRDFEFIKEKLNDYLLRIKEEKKRNTHIYDCIYSDILMKDFTDKGKESIASDEYLKAKRYIDNCRDGRYQSLSKKAISFVEKYKDYGHKELLSVIPIDLKDEEKVKKYFDIELKNILFLNFNYTDTERLYLEENNAINTEVIHIHGELNEVKNSIIFGYGDELEENYNKLENLQNNAYLENIKSIKYQETDNYKRMLNFIDSDKYQIIILGHSCGNSDRTLLNTLFEHENCVSIKPYYYQFKDEKTGEIKDNYSDIVRNISRCFTDKKSMRDKVVNKTYTDWFSRNIE